MIFGPRVGKPLAFVGWGGGGSFFVGEGRAGGGRGGSFSWVGVGNPPASFGPGNGKPLALFGWGKGKNPCGRGGKTPRFSWAGGGNPPRLRAGRGGGEPSRFSGGDGRAGGGGDASFV